MTEKNYHHGNLRQALIEAGIQIIIKEGERGLSLRKVAKECGVSQAAPYAHFKSKEDLLTAMQEHVTEQFVEVLQDSMSKDEPYSKEAVIHLGVAYIRFFMERPYYFHFLYDTPYFQIDITTEERENAYPPYELFQKVALNALEKSGYTKEEMLYGLTNMWATVQGITMLATSPNVNYAGDMEQDLYRILMLKEARDAKTGKKERN